MPPFLRTPHSLLLLLGVLVAGFASACATTSPPPVPDDPEVEKVAGGFEFIEGPYWHEDGYLLFSDIPANTIYRWTPGEGTAVYHEPSGNSNGITADEEGNLILAQHGRRRIARVDAEGNETAVAERYQGDRLNSPNDVVVASDGSMYFTDPPYGIEEGEQELDVNGVYRVPAGGGAPEQLVDDFARPNGIALSPDESKLYVNDTQRGHIRVFDVQDDGSTANGRLFAELEDPNAQGGPDGMKVDAQGNVYSTGPGGVWVFSPEGELLSRISVPGQSTNVGWGGEDLKTLFVTSTEGLFRVPLNVRGVQQQ